ncbi:phytanoyl-CoA dioxygenase family protein [Nonomuraea sp. NPDC050404]|uniref:phytanoyl-CoA dioxygenase family protein n=1 Tax=Nonomuraea sp. NPDC050404 TaxID=3155783 RepID=UPI0033DCB164
MTESDGVHTPASLTRPSRMNPPAHDRTVGPGAGGRLPASRSGVHDLRGDPLMELNAHFQEHGYARLDRAFPAAAAADMARALWSALAERHGVDRDRPGTWAPAEPRGLGALSRKGVFDRLASPAVVAAIGALLGRADWPRPPDWGTALVTFPTPGEWDVPVGGWHIDYPARGASGAGLLLKWLAYLAPVGPGGGGTVVLAGSHRLVEDFLRQADEADQGRSPAVRDAILGLHPWLRDLRRPGPAAERVARLMGAGVSVSGVPVRVVELTGEPGDVVFMHPHLLHAAAPNRSAAPRFMVTGGAVEAKG